MKDEYISDFQPLGWYTLIRPGVVHFNRPLTLAASSTESNAAGREGLLSALRQFAAEVHNRYPDIAIYLFGSLASAERWRGAASDIDLAVAGVHGVAYNKKHLILPAVGDSPSQVSATKAARARRTPKSPESNFPLAIITMIS